MANLTFSGSSPSVLPTRNLTALWVVREKSSSALMTGTTTLAAVKALNATVLTIPNISVADNTLFQYAVNITNRTTLGLFTFYVDRTGSFSANSFRRIANPGPGAVVNCIVPTCKTTEYLNTPTNTCLLCSQGYVNSTSCSFGTGDVTCSYGVSTITSTGQPGQCKALTCPTEMTLSKDGTKWLNCSGTSGCDAACGVCPDTVATRCTTGYYHLNPNSVCQLCSTTFKNSTACTSAGATACSYGAISKIGNVNQCVSVTCTTGSYVNATGSGCVLYSKTFPNSTTCTLAGTTACS
ncbi:hypothetical protein MVLG_01356 [Microbotryum lychnidis-dioicae p1A1 Lamole]|uniref:Uncharacterized protein n=1 Tax=Microbotryum lychnidis-dioicae (strain p1A1 Lamole / MvSl-1064) TaxID=683840 RepID=U5H1V9_USTV1|nr:hypothetical protein MVLG_01356 [Microbotryum lychnidis-dioicae p1A1 Lamole]|eukprot:KDE08583.1 hypothetical protein MVLG_01356 [Microbotryum lychnidis-dioicae p1A1 Lamole]